MKVNPAQIIPLSNDIKKVDTKSLIMEILDEEIFKP